LNITAKDNEKHSQTPVDTYTICFSPTLQTLNIEHTGSPYTFVIQAKAPTYKAKLVIVAYNSASIDHASSFLRNLTKYKIHIQSTF